MAAEPVAGEPRGRVLSDRAERGKDGRSRDGRRGPRRHQSHGGIASRGKASQASRSVKAIRVRAWRISLTHRVAAKPIMTGPLAAKPAAFNRKELPGQS